MRHGLKCGGVDFKIHLQEAREILEKLRLDLQKIDQGSFQEYAQSQAKLCAKMLYNLDRFAMQIDTKRQMRRMLARHPDAFEGLPQFLKELSK